MHNLHIRVLDKSFGLVVFNAQLTFKSFGLVVFKAQFTGLAFVQNNEIKCLLHKSFLQ